MQSGMRSRDSVVEREKQERGDVQGTGAGDLRCGSRVWGEGRLLLCLGRAAAAAVLVAGERGR